MKPPLQILEALALQHKDQADECWTGVLRLADLKKWKADEVKVVLLKAHQLPAVLNGKGGKNAVPEDALYLAVEIPAPAPKSKAPAA